MNRTDAPGFIAGILGATLLAGCASQGPRVTAGDQREALRTVEVLNTMPDDGKSLGKVRASSCKRQLFAGSTSRPALVRDLRVKAYGRGADAIANVYVETSMGIMHNCWSRLEGSATAVKLPPASTAPE